MVRELGHELIPLEEVRARILSLVSPLPAESVPLGRAWNRVLREDLAASDPVPPFAVSSMDGFAVLSADLAPARPGRPAELRVEATVLAGGVPEGPVLPGTAVRIMTGAPIPEGADAVLPRELARAEGGSVFFEGAVSPGANVRPAGVDLRPGDIPLRAGARLRGPQLALAAVLGKSRLSVTRRPRAAILSSGDELVEPGAPRPPGGIFEANGYALAGLLEEMGIEPVRREIVPDRREDIREALRRAAAGGADAVISTGGVSAGERDLVQEILREEGRPGWALKAAIRPGKPQAFGRIDGIPVFGLPGNPASAIVSFAVLLRPALRRILGEVPEVEPTFPVRFRKPYAYRPGRTFLLRARVEPDPESGCLVVAGAGEQDSSALSSLARANALVLLPGDRDEAPAGVPFPAIWLRS